MATGKKAGNCEPGAPASCADGERARKGVQRTKDAKNAAAQPPAQDAEAGCGEEKGRLPAPKRHAVAADVLRLLSLRYPHPETHLAHHTPWELLVATVLAAQCTDERVNTVTPRLFARWPGPAELAGAELAEVEDCIRSTGFYRNKAKNLMAAARRLVDVYGGNVPDRMEDLLTLAGVARKTANVVLFGAFGINVGLAVDTHVGRIARRLGLTDTLDPVKAERQLMELFPPEAWGDVNHRMVWFGRHVCDSRKPRCESCEMADFCPKNGVMLRTI